MKRVFLVLLLCSVATTIWAQVQVPFPTPSNTRLQWDHDGVNVDSFTLAIDGNTPTDLGKPTPTGTTYQAPFPALTPGSHTLVLCAKNVAGVGCAPPFGVTMIAIPNIPTNMRITVIVPQQ